MSTSAGDPAEIARLEAEVQQLKSDLEKCQKDAADLEKLADAARPQDLESFLKGCQVLYRKIRTGGRTLTGGVTTKPQNRLYPNIIERSVKIEGNMINRWKDLKECKKLWKEKTFPSTTNMDFIGQLMRPISSEDELRFAERIAIEENVVHVIKAIGRTTGRHDLDRISYESKSPFQAAAATPDASSPQSGPRNTRADQFWVFTQTDNALRPIVVVEYKPPHKFSVDEIAACSGTIKPEEDIIESNEDSAMQNCRRLFATVIVQLFDYMINREVQYGYISTGICTIFGTVSDDGETFGYFTHIPTEDRLRHCSWQCSVGMIAAFVLDALEAPRWVQASGKDPRSRLKRWPSDRAPPPKSPTSAEENASEHSKVDSPPRRNDSPVRDRRRTRSYTSGGQPTHNNDDDGDESETDSNRPPSGTCNAPNSRRRREQDEDEDEDGAGSHHDGRADQRSAKRSKQSSASHRKEDDVNTAPSSQQHTSTVKSTDLGERLFCTHRCLLGLCHGLALDPNCPNAVDHGAQHMLKVDFLKLIRESISNVANNEVKSMPMWLYGAQGALFKVHLTASGYTLVAKGMRRKSRPVAENEYRIYQSLESLQATIVPVCCGLVRSSQPYYFDEVALQDFILMSFAGQPFVSVIESHGITAELKRHLLQQRDAARRKILSLGVIHGDDADRNVTYDESSDTVMIIDFGDSRVARRQPLGHRPVNQHGSVKQCAPDMTSLSASSKQVGLSRLRGDLS